MTHSFFVGEMRVGEMRVGEMSPIRHATAVHPPIVTCEVNGDAAPPDFQHRLYKRGGNCLLELCLNGSYAPGASGRNEGTYHYMPLNEQSP